jgi:hypothetical protein
MSARVHAVRVVSRAWIFDLVGPGGRYRTGGAYPKEAERMTDPTAEFFDGLSRRGFEPLLRGVTATMRFDIAGDGATEQWWVTIEEGGIHVAHNGSGVVDCMIQTDRAVFDQIASGRTNTLAAALRGELHAAGNPELLVMFQRLAPSAPRDPQPVGADGGA